MFNDHRSKKVIVLSHCLLNQNSISDGTSDFPSQYTEIIEFLMKKNVGMIQLPCPEMVYLGLDRKDKNGSKRPLLDENSRIRNLMEEPDNIQILRQKAGDVIEQIKEYQKHDFQVLGLIGVNRSPSCGIETTTKNGVEEKGKGVFMKVLSDRLIKHEITLPMIGTKTSEVEGSIEKVRKLVK